MSIVYEMYEDMNNGCVYLFAFDKGNFSVPWSVKYDKDEMHICATVWALLCDGIEGPNDCAETQDLKYNEVVMHTEWVGASDWDMPYCTHGIDRDLVGQSGKEILECYNDSDFRPAEKKYIVRWSYNGRFEGWLGYDQAFEIDEECIRLFDTREDAEDDAIGVWHLLDVDDEKRYCWDWKIIEYWH